MNSGTKSSKDYRQRSDAMMVYPHWDSPSVVAVTSVLTKEVSSLSSIILDRKVIGVDRGMCVNLPFGWLCPGEGELLYISMYLFLGQMLQTLEKSAKLLVGGGRSPCNMRFLVESSSSVTVDVGHLNRTT